uniref:Uncharacterized protein n=1 Tax=Romanomermis culicivorax TaxID=13658 RepID=A0A915I727_ROMCU
MPVPKPYVSRMITSTPPRPIVFTSSQSTSHISSAAPLVQENGDPDSESCRILPTVSPELANEKMTGSIEENKVTATEKKEKDHVLMESKIPSAARNSKSTVTATTNLTPTSESHPEKLTFTRKIEKFQQEIVNQCSLTDKSKLPTLNKVPQSRSVEKSDVPINDSRNRVKEDVANQVNDNTACNNSPSGSAVPSIVRTKKAENRLKFQHTSDDSPDLGESLSPAELRALEAAKRAEWRKARLKSLERDALKAEKVMLRVRDISQEKDHDCNEDFAADNVECDELDYGDESAHLAGRKPS